MDQHGFPGLQGAVLHQVGIDGQHAFRQGRGFGQADAFRDRQEMTDVDADIFGIAAAIHQGADCVADLPGRILGLHDRRVDFRDRARHLKPQARRGARRRRIQPAPLQDIRPVHPGETGPYQDKSRSRFGARPLFDVKVRRILTVAVDRNGLHGDSFSLISSPNRRFIALRLFTPRR